MKSFKNESGRSMIEMLGVLAIIGVLSVGGIAGYSKAMMKYRINKTIEQITLIAGNVRTFFATQKNYDGLDSSTDDGNTLIKKAKLIPDEMWNDGNIVSVFGTDVAIKATTITNSPDNENRAFSINIKDVPDEAYISLITYEWASANIDRIDFCGTTGDIYNYDGPMVNGAIPLDFLMVECEGRDVSDLGFVFTR